MSSSDWAASSVPFCTARNSSPCGTSWSEVKSSITISPFAAALKASIEGLITSSASAAPA